MGPFKPDNCQVVSPEYAMTTRREFIGSLPAATAAFAVAGSFVLEESPPRAQEPTTPLAGHFDPKGKAPSKFTLEVLKRAKADLPFADERDFEEQKKGLIAHPRRPRLDQRLGRL